MEMIKLLQFGSPQVQETYKELCETSKIKFDDFQLKLIEDTGKSYDQLKEFWTDGISVDVSEEEFNEMEPVSLVNYLIVHFDVENGNVLGIIPEEYEVYTDGFYFFEEDTFSKEKEIRSTLRQYI